MGIGDSISQIAFIKNHQELINAIDRALASKEFAGLSLDQQQAFGDTAAVVKEESAKTEPDVGKLKRWGTRLGGLAKEFGMSIATSELVELLNIIFGG